MLEPVIFSLKVATISTIFSLLIGVPFAYFINKKNISGKSILETLITLPLILPPSVIGYLLLVLFGAQSAFGQFLSETLGIQVVFAPLGAVIAGCVVSLPLMYQSVKSALLSVNPNYEAAARTLGSGEWKIFFTVTLPLAWPGIVSGMVMSFARAVGEFGATLMIAGNIPGQTQTVSVAIYYAVESGDTYTANVLVAIMTIFSFFLIFFMNKWIKKVDIHTN